MNLGNGYSVVFVRSDEGSGLQDSQGRYRVTTDPGSGFYAPNGAVRVTQGGPKGLYPVFGMNGKQTGILIGGIYFGS